MEKLGAVTKGIVIGSVVIGNVRTMSSGLEEVQNIFTRTYRKRCRGVLVVKRMASILRKRDIMYWVQTTGIQTTRHSRSLSQGITAPG